MRKFVLVLGAVMGFSAATLAADDDAYNALMNSMKERNGVGLDRIKQDDMQRECSNPEDRIADPKRSEELRMAALNAVPKPSDGVYLGDWKRGKEIAANGKGLQFSDDQNAPNGGNCYACHQLDPEEVAYGTLGPSLTNYGMRGQSQPVLDYTWSKIWNPNAWVPCSHMPRFGTNGVLTEQQIKDIMALLLDPASPVNTQQQ